MSETNINKLIKHILKPHLMLGDLECHKTNRKGKNLEKVINNLCILNNIANNYLNPFIGSYLAIDLSLCNPVSYIDYGWKVHNDLCSSDHCPIILESLQFLHEDRLPQWKIKKANWQVFETLCKQKLLQDPNIIDQTKHFTKTLISIANKTIAKT